MKWQKKLTLLSITAVLFFVFGRLQHKGSETGLAKANKPFPSTTRSDIALPSPGANKPQESQGGSVKTGKGFWVSEETWGDFEVNPLVESGSELTISPDIKEILRMSSDECEQINFSISKVVKFIRQTERDLSEEVPTSELGHMKDPQSTVFSMPPLPSGETSRLEHLLKESVYDSLGDTRGWLLWEKLHDSSLTSSYLRGFGQLKLVVGFERPRTTPGAPIFRFTESLKSSTGESLTFDMRSTSRRGMPTCF